MKSLGAALMAAGVCSLAAIALCLIVSSPAAAQRKSEADFTMA